MGLIPWQRLVLDWQKCLQSTTQHKDVEERCSESQITRLIIAAPLISAVHRRKRAERRREIGAVMRPLSTLVLFVPFVAPQENSWNDPWIQLTTECQDKNKCDGTDIEVKVENKCDSSEVNNK